MFFDINFIFCSRFWLPIYINFATVVYKFFIFPLLLLNIYHSHLPTPLCFILPAVRSFQNGFHKFIFLSGGKQCVILLLYFSKNNTKWIKFLLAIKSTIICHISFIASNNWKLIEYIISSFRVSQMKVLLNLLIHLHITATI